MTETTMPSDLSHGKVIGRFILAVADGSDVDRLPDARPATGKITFSSVNPIIKALVPEPTTVGRGVYTFQLDQDGWLVDDRGMRGIWLVAGAYKVAYNLDGINIGSHTINVVPENSEFDPLDLYYEIPSTGSYPSKSEYVLLNERIDNEMEAAAQAAAAPAVAAAQQAAADAQTAVDGMNAVGSLRDSTTPGLLDYTLGADGPDPEPLPVTLLADDFTGDGVLNGRTPQTGPAWVAAAGWATTAGLAKASAAGTAVLDAARSDDLDATFDLSVNTSGSGTWRLYISADATLASGLWLSAQVTGGTISASVWKTVSGASTNLGAMPVTGLPAGSSTPVRATLTARSGQFIVTLADPTGATVYGSATHAVTDRPGTRVGVNSIGGGASGLSLDRLAATRPADPITPEPDGKIVTVTDTGVLPAVVLDDLDARYSSGTVGAASALELLRALKDFAAGQVTVAVVSDSTANDPTDWIRLWMQKWGPTLPTTVRRTYRAWNNSTSAWGSETVDNAGAAPAPGVIVDDTFTRTGEVIGSTPDTGPAWAGSVAGAWTLDGTKAVNSAVGALSQNMLTRDSTVTLTLALTTTGTGTAQAFRVYVAAQSTGLGSGVWLSLNLSAAGALTATGYKTIAGGATTAITSTVTPAGVTTNSATPQTVTVEVGLAIQNATFKIIAGGQTTTLAGTVTEADYATFGTNSGWSGYKGATAYGFAVDRAQLKTPAADNPVAPATLAVHNAAIAGANMATFDAAKRAAMFGALDVDVLIFSMGHNQSTQKPAPFVDLVQSWLDAWQAEHPAAAVLVSSQNPQVAPASGIVAHRDRQAALRKWAKANGHDYVPAFEAFTAKPDGGASLIGSDGVHPTTPPSGTTGSYGSVLWADTALAALVD